MEETLIDDKESDKRIKELEKEKGKIESFFNELEMMEQSDKGEQEKRKKISLKVA